MARLQAAERALRTAAFCALLLSAAPGCGALMGIAGYPPEALRKTQPVGIKARAVTIGAATAATTLLDQNGNAVRFGGPSNEETLVVFYRGHW